MLIFWYYYFITNTVNSAVFKAYKSDFGQDVFNSAWSTNLRRPDVCHEVRVYHVCTE